MKPAKYSWICNSTLLHKERKNKESQIFLFHQAKVENAALNETDLGLIKSLALVISKKFEKNNLMLIL